MTELFKSLSRGLSRFVLGWLLPSVLTVGFFTWLVLPALPIAMQPYAGQHRSVNLLTASAVFVLAAVTLALLFAFCSQPIYRVLEGYAMPKPLARRLRRRHLREWHRLQILATLDIGTDAEKGLLIERRLLYPEDCADVQATRLGNALRALENYGDSRYGLDGQTFWYELISVGNARLRSDIEDTRSAVDFFVSLLSHCVLLAIVSAPIGAATQEIVPLVVAAASLAIAAIAYRGAVNNVLEWRYVVQALLNTSRPQLAQSMGFSLPDTFEFERTFWEYLRGLVTAGPRRGYLSWLDQYRVRYSRDSQIGGDIGSPSDSTVGEASDC